MRGITLNFKTGALAVQQLPTPRLASRTLLVRNEYSLISSGTEGHIIAMARKGPLGKALDRPDLAMQVINRALHEGIWSTANVVRNLVETPLPLGYSSAGVVLETGGHADPFRPGDRVACAGLGQANHAEHVVVPITMAWKVPAGVSTQDAAFGTLGAIALHSVRLAKPEIGETFAVIGLGLLGQLCVQILKACGCKVAGFDLDEHKVHLALASGLDAGGVVGRDAPLERVLGLNNGYGADGVIVAAHSHSNDPIALAAELSRERGRVIALGLVDLDVPRRAFFEKEITLEVPRAYGAGAYDADYERYGRDYPFAYVRWTEGRNLGAFIDLIARRRVNVQPLITHTFPLDEVQKAYAIAMGEDREPHLAVMFQYDGPAAPERFITLPSKPAAARERDLCFGVIGTGRFAQGILLPALKSHAGVTIGAVASARGLTARHVGEKYAGASAASDYGEIIGNPDIGSVLIATRHDSHAEIVAAAMKAGKNVFVEKPLATTEEQLNHVLDAHQTYPGRLMVGFNRRFSPLCREFAARLQGRQQPLAVSFRFVTPRILKGHESEWVHEPESGGSRIIGEMCHMVDTCAFLVSSPIATVYARSIGGDARGMPTYDTVHATLAYEDGSIATLMYVANSDATIAQERIELAWEGAYGLIDNYRKGYFSRRGKRSRSFGVNQRKGWPEEVAAFIACLRNGEPDPIPFASLVETTRVTFAIHRSLQTGEVVPL